MVQIRTFSTKEKQFPILIRCNKMVESLNFCGLYSSNSGMGMVFIHCVLYEMEVEKQTKEMQHTKKP